MCIRDRDDPRLPTIRAIRRRGIKAEALKKFMIDMGVGTTDVSISMESLYAENRKIVDPIANRYFFVWDLSLIHIFISNVASESAGHAA